MHKFPSILILTAMSFSALSQSGFVDDFEDNSMTRTVGRDNRTHILWSTECPGTYKLTEQNGVFRIDYAKVAGVGAFDRFSLNLPYPVNVSGNPRIQLSLKSSVATTLTLRPTYSQRPPTYQYLEQQVPGDNSWHTYAFDLYDYLYTKFPVRSLDFYFDRGMAEPSSGTIELDNVKIAGFLIEVSDLNASVRNGRDVVLSWENKKSEATSGYKIYRNLESRFTPDETTFIAETAIRSYADLNLRTNTFYYYQVVPVDTANIDYFPSIEVGVETYEPGKVPAIKVGATNTNTVKKYEKFELILELSNVSIHNPYDPEDIDTYGYFKSPAGDTIWINGFYDNYQGVDQWKLRFSPDQTGNWEYQIFVKDAGGIGQTPIGNFEATESDHHGWIRASKTNPHFFRHDDGASYYAVGVYSPWRNNEERINTFIEHDANLLAIWDIGYGGFVNETGIIEEELGRYNDRKLGRIDSLLEILEANDIQLMYAIWPHDLFSETVWAAEWDKNPYNQLADVVDVYSDAVVWEYQKRKYRYLIARYAYSRSMGIWELINEMNGTDGWMEARYEEAYGWVQKANEYFRNNDPYGHPITSSFSGGLTEYRERLYTLNDVPNIHVYEAQGWMPKYPDDSTRSSMYNYAWASRRFWDNFDKPALFGEAGADLAYYKRQDPRYHEAYHNAIWASLTNGLAGIPVWWMFHHLSDQDWDDLKHLAAFVSDIDLANQPYQLADVKSEGADAFGLATGSDAFGWIRSYTNADASGSMVEIDGLQDGKYEIEWFDTWNGTDSKTKAISKAGTLTMTSPKLEIGHPDIGFKIRKIKD